MAAAAGFSPLQQQPPRFGQASMPHSPATGLGSRSLQELDRLSRFDRFHGGIGGRRPMVPARDYLNFPSRSMNYLDRMEPEDFYRSPGRSQPGIVDDFALQAGTDSQDLLLSEYANYLNSQFMQDQRERELLDFEQQQQQQFAARPPLYGQEQFGPWGQGFSQQFTARPPYGQEVFGHGIQPASTPYFPPAAQNYVPPSQFGPTSYQSPIGVYSRSEANYGARPPAQWTTDYGNLSWRPHGQAAYGQAYASPSAQSWPGRFQTGYGQASAYGQGYNQMSAGAAASQRLAQQQRAQQPQSILRRRAPPLRPTAAGGDECWPREMEWPRSGAATTGGMEMGGFGW